MARNKHASPVLDVEITKAERDNALRSNSGGCLIADAIKRQYPNLTGVTVDMTTVRATDRDRGERYIYLTPPSAQHILLAFDQGWRHPVERVLIKRAVQIVPVTAPSGPKKVARAWRLAYLEKQEEAGALTHTERRALTRMRNNPNPEPPPSTGPAEARVEHRVGGVVIRGGQPRVQGPNHPNLLRGRDRHFGAKLADPGQAFNEAVEQAVAARFADGQTG